MPISTSVESETPPAAACCAEADAASQGTCALCAGPLCRRCGGLVNGRALCAACLRQVQLELAAETARGAHVPMGLVGGIAGALLGGAIWAGVAILTSLAIGYVAVLVGFLAGYGTHLAAGRRKGRPLQVVAVACSLLGLLVGRYLIVAHGVMHLDEVKGTGLTYADPRLMRFFFAHLTDFLRAFDLLWMLIALGAAVRVTRPTMTRVRAPRPAR